MRTDLLLELADILERADDEHRARGEPTYRQAAWLHPCGTPACAGGHWAAAHPERWDFNTSGAPFLREHPLDTVSCAMHEFGISFLEALELFDLNGCGGAKTAKEAAAYIRKFVARHTEAE